MYELDDSLTLYLTHSNLSNQGRGLREGAEVEVTNAHMLRLSAQLYKVPPQLMALLWKIEKFAFNGRLNFFQKMSGFVCCPVGRIEVVHFSEKETNFKVSCLF